MNAKGSPGGSAVLSFCSHSLLWVSHLLLQSCQRVVAGGMDQKRPLAPGTWPCHQGNITLLWNEVILSSRCKEMGIYVTVGMVFIFSNFQITFD